jgi:hypothetical protein
LYTASFFLVAVGSSGMGASNIGKVSAPGYSCAYLTLAVPMIGNKFGHDGIFANKVLEFFSALISGWINPVFLIAVFFPSLSRSQRLVSALKNAVVLMIPFCWLLFVYDEIYPREGHFVWIFGILLTLFSRELARAFAANFERGGQREPA